MTAKDEALELVNMFRPQQHAYGVWRSDDLQLLHGKESARIAVKRILLVLENELIELFDGARGCDVNNRYQTHYLEVLEEIDNI